MSDRLEIALLDAQPSVNLQRILIKKDCENAFDQCHLSWNCFPKQRNKEKKRKRKQKEVLFTTDYLIVCDQTGKNVCKKAADFTLARKEIFTQICTKGDIPQSLRGFLFYSTTTKAV